MMVCSFSFPESMRHDLDAKHIMPWTDSDEFDSYSDALDYAKEKANELNFPVQVYCLGRSQVIYPDALNALGY